MATFSERQGYSPKDPEIKIRNEAPHDLRGVLVDIAYESGLTPHTLRSLICRLFRAREDSSNWSAFPNVDSEVRGLIDSCDWFRVYDAIEAIYNSLLEINKSGSGFTECNPSHFEHEINAYFRQKGIGWQLTEGQIQVRGTDGFEESISEAHKALAQTERPTASKELHHAIKDLSARPEPDITGAIQHSMAALECVARDVSGDEKATLGTILSRNPGLVPKPLDQALEKLWGFASEQGRHIREGRVPDFSEAQLVVHISATVAKYMAERTSSDRSKLI
jgi:hypothetical protein